MHRLALSRSTPRVELCRHSASVTWTGVPCRGCMERVACMRTYNGPHAQACRWLFVLEAAQAGESGSRCMRLIGAGRILCCGLGNWLVGVRL